MAEELTDWRVVVILNRKSLVDEITKLAQILARQRVDVTVSAVSEEDALMKAADRLQRHIGISTMYVKAFHPRKLPT